MLPTIFQVYSSRPSSCSSWTAHVSPPALRKQHHTPDAWSAVRTALSMQILIIIVNQNLCSIFDLTMNILYSLDTWIKFWRSFLSCPSLAAYWLCFFTEISSSRFVRALSYLTHPALCAENRYPPKSLRDRLCSTRIDQYLYNRTVQ